MGKGAFKGLFLAFFFIFLCLPLPISGAQGVTSHFPVINRLDPTDIGFRQFISDVESNRRRAFQSRRNPQEAASLLTIYQYTPREGEDLFFLAARSAMPYSALVSLNRLTSPHSVLTGTPLLLPSFPGIFVPTHEVGGSSFHATDLEKFLGAERLNYLPSVEINIPIAGRVISFHFFPGADFTPTERTFFLNPGFRFPLDNFRLTSGFGTRLCPIMQNSAFHRGLDLAAPEGTPVFAAADGIVTEIGYNHIYGNFIVIAHRNNITSFYGHLQRVETTLQANVRSGTLIGRVGSTGLSTGPHLHFELRHGGRAFDPTERLPPLGGRR